MPAAQAEADEARDRELLGRLEARRKARQEKQQQLGREEFPPTIERRERVLDLPEDQKEGLKPIGVKISERLRFEKPHLYVEVIKRPQYVVAGQPEKGVQSVPPPLSIVEGCKYDFSVVAAVAAMKFAFHIPTYRQQDWFAQSGWFPSRSTDAEAQFNDATAERGAIPYATVATQLGLSETAARQAVHRMRDEVARLPRRQREVFALRFFVGLDLEGIAAALSVDVGTVKTHLHRAVHRVRLAVEEARP